jgi:YHS domain-containing protein
LKTIIFFILVYLAYRVVKSSVSVKTIRWPEEKENGEPQVKASEEMVFDQVCKSYIPVATSISVSHDGKVLYFCGEECKKKFLESLKA